MDPISEQDKLVLKATVELLWKKGTTHPQEAAVGLQFTQLVERLLKPVAEAPKKD